jgi:hypothetical protein
MLVVARTNTKLPLAPTSFLRLPTNRPSFLGLIPVHIKSSASGAERKLNQNVSPICLPFPLPVLVSIGGKGVAELIEIERR